MRNPYLASVAMKRTGRGVKWSRQPPAQRTDFIREFGALPKLVAGSDIVAREGMVDLESGIARLQGAISGAGIDAEIAPL